MDAYLKGLDLPQIKNLTNALDIIFMKNKLNKDH
jgi:hypothetical protein